MPGDLNLFLVLTRDCEKKTWADRELVEVNPIEGEVLVVDRVQRSSHHSRLHLGGCCHDVWRFISAWWCRGTKETRKSPCAAFQGEAAASHRGHCKKTTQVFSFVEKMKICVFFWWWSSHQNGESGQSMWRNFLWAFFHQVATIMAECHICRIYIVNIVTPIITNHYQIHFTLNKQPLSFIKIIVKE